MSIPSPDSTGPVKKALLRVLAEGFIYLRSISRDQTSVTDGMIFDLADALHVVPNVIDHYGPGHDADYLLECFFRPFDKTWANRRGVLNLEASFCAALKGKNSSPFNPL